MRIDENLCEVDLTPFLEQSGVYSISLLHNMRSLLEEPVSILLGCLKMLKSLGQARTIVTLPSTRFR